jgi:hypothetical protein
LHHNSRGCFTYWRGYLKMVVSCRNVSDTTDNMYVLVRENCWFYEVNNSYVTKSYLFTSNTGRFIMFSVITNIYNKKTKGPTLMELFTATGKLKKDFFDN